MRNFITKLKFIFVILKGGMEFMVDVYVTLIVHTDISGYTIENVPEQLRPAVLAKLAILGLDGYGKPLVQG